MLRQIPIRLNSEDPKEFTIIEVQGEFEFLPEDQSMNGEVEFDNNVLGNLKKSIGDTYDLVVGTGLMKGKL